MGVVVVQIEYSLIMRDSFGEIVAAAQEERFTRQKHDPDFPVQAIDYCLREGGLRAIVSLNTEPKPAEVIAAGLRHHAAEPVVRRLNR